MKKERIHLTCEDGHRMSILVYRPDSPSGEPVTGILWIHGGGLCAALCMLARDRGDVNIAFQMPLLPVRQTTEGCHRHTRSYAQRSRSTVRHSHSSRICVLQV